MSDKPVQKTYEEINARIKAGEAVIVTAEEMVDKCKDPTGLRNKVHAQGGVIGRPELDDDDAQPKE